MAERVAIRPGTILDLPAWAWHRGDGPLKLRVLREMREINEYAEAEGEIWIEGERLDPPPGKGRWIQVLVKVEALPTRH